MNSTMLPADNTEFVGAIRRLIERVIYKECASEGGDDQDAAVEDVVDATFVVLRAILTAPEFSALHEWANGQLTVMLGDAAGDDPSIADYKASEAAGSEQNQELSL